MVILYLEVMEIIRDTSTRQEKNNELMQKIQAIQIDLHDEMQNTLINIDEINILENSKTNMITYEDYQQNSNCFAVSKLPELRSILKHYKSNLQLKIRYPFLQNYSASDLQHLKKRIKEMYDFALTGTKQKHIDRILAFFKQISAATQIQKIARGRLVRLAHLLRGPARKDRSICVNESDFYTLEPLNEIPFSNFFSFTGEKGFVYGCELTSIVKHIQNKSHRVKNPYTREIIDPIIPTIYRMSRLQKMFFSRQNGDPIVLSCVLNNTNRNNSNSNSNTSLLPLDPTLQNNPLREVRALPLSVNLNHLQHAPISTQTRLASIISRHHHNHNSRIPITNDASSNINNQIVTIMSITNGERLPETRGINGRIASRNTVNSNYNVDDMIEKVRQIRRQNFQDRARSLFMEIDQLGHYTQAEWFTQLTAPSYLRFFRCLRDLWMYRAQLSLDTKLRICPLWDPFISLTYDQINYSELSLEQIRTLCISVMEDMVFTGIDNENKMLGSFHVLSALTVVSLPARNNMMWLYESLAY